MKRFDVAALCRDVERRLGLAEGKVQFRLRLEDADGEVYGTFPDGLIFKVKMPFKYLDDERYEAQLPGVVAIKLGMALPAGRLIHAIKEASKGDGDLEGWERALVQEATR